MSMMINSFCFGAAAPVSAFKATVNNSSGGFTLPLVNGTIYNFFVDWGDGSAVDHITLWNQTEATHSYPTNGSYQMSITGAMPRWSFGGGGSCTKLVSVDSWGNIVWSSMNGAFYGCSNCVSFVAGGNFSLVTDFANAWRFCSAMTSFPALGLNAGTDFTNAWYACSSLVTFNAADLSHGTIFQNAWRGCSALVTFSATGTGAGTNFTDAWNGCNHMTSFPLIDTSHATTLYGAWVGCTALTSFPLIVTANVLDFTNAWYGCSGLTSFPLIDTGKGTNFLNAWRDCSGLTSFPLIDTSRATSFETAWRNCTGLTSFPLLAATTVTNFYQTWNDCTHITSLPAIDMTNGVGDYTDTFKSMTALTSCGVLNLKATASFVGDALGAAAINTLFGNLATVTSKTITVTGNPGAATCTPSIATAKGWTVVN